MKCLEAAGDIRCIAPHGTLDCITPLFSALDWSTERHADTLELGRYYSPTWQLTHRMPDRRQWALDVSTRWPNVDRLREQALTRHWNGLDVAAAVTARVAVEEAVELALKDLGVDPAWPPANRERQLEEHLKQTKDFEPLDRASTFAQLSAIRDGGNSAAHGGQVDNPAVLASQLLLISQALVSLSAAVDAAS